MANLSLIPRLNYNFCLRNVIMTLLKKNIKSTNNYYFENIFQTPNFFFTNHARTGVRLLLNSLDLKNDAYIGVQAYNCNTVFEAIHKAGYKPVFIDINDQLTLDIDDLKNKVLQIDALIVTHTFGIPAEINEIRNIIGNKPMIEDCAHSFLSKYNNKITGTFGDASIFSFGNAKFPAIGAGGMVVLYNENYLERFKRLYDELPYSSRISIIKGVIKNFIFTLAHNKFIYKFFSYPFLKKVDRKLDFGGKFKWKEQKLSPFLEKIIYFQSSNFNQYLNLQKTNANLILQKLPLKILISNYTLNTDQIFFMIPVIVENRKKMIHLFFKAGVEVGPHFSKSIEWAKLYGYTIGDCPNADSVVDSIVCIPTYYSLTSGEIKKIQKTIEEIEITL